MDPTIVPLISSVVGSQIVIEIVRAWLASRKETQHDASARLDLLESRVSAERLKTEEVQQKLFDLSVKHEGLLVRFDVLQQELRACKEKEHGTALTISH